MYLILLSLDIYTNIEILFNEIKTNGDLLEIVFSNCCYIQPMNLSVTLDLKQPDFLVMHNHHFKVNLIFQSKPVGSSGSQL